MNEALQQHLKFIFNQFKIKSSFVSYKELASGHINDTYFIETSKKPAVILQRINHGVFKDVPSLIANKVAISKHIIKKLHFLSLKDLAKKVVQFVSTNNKEYYVKDEEGNFWNMMLFIENSLTFEKVTSENLAYEGGKLFGEFLQLTNDFKVNQLTEVIPKFHDMSFRFQQFEAALKIASKERIETAKNEIAKVWKLKDEMHILQHLKESGQLKIRVTHNDTKIANALFNVQNKGICVIDTDTVMPGIVHYDFGDSVRTFCTSVPEDEKNLDLVYFKSNYYNAYKKGFLEALQDDLSTLELEHLPLGAKTMIFIMALRFLTDFLNGDIYYKTAYSTHNLVRSKNQFKLIESFTEYFQNQLN